MENNRSVNITLTVGGEETRVTSKSQTVDLSKEGNYELAVSVDGDAEVIFYGRGSVLKVKEDSFNDIHEVDEVSVLPLVLRDNFVVHFDEDSISMKEISENFEFRVCLGEFTPSDLLRLSMDSMYTTVDTYIDGLGPVVDMGIVYGDVSQEVPQGQLFAVIKEIEND